ncbi:hypothetical protein ABKN59_010479 [Abortiporus biennis]
MDDHCDPFYQFSSTTSSTIQDGSCKLVIPFRRRRVNIEKRAIGVFVPIHKWDISRRLWFPDFVYFAARLSCLGYALSSLILVDFPVDCRPLNLALTWTASFSVCITSLLFFFRIRAVFYGALLVTGQLYYLVTIGTTQDWTTSRSLRHSGIRW